MAYNKFSLERFVYDFDFKTETWINPFEHVKPTMSSAFLTDMLKDALPLGVAIGTEKARSEFIVAPILLEVKRLTNNTISIFSGKSFDIDPARGLKGACDFILSRNPEQMVMREPILSVVEAKKSDLEEGIGQCAAEMYAAQLFNERHGTPQTAIFGAVTTGIYWKFLRLADKTLYIQPLSTSVEENLPDILGMLLYTMAK